MDRQQQLALRLIVLALSLITTAVLLLSAAGIYALMSFTVSRRQKEIGIRAAMGADPTQLLRGIFRESRRATRHRRHRWHWAVLSDRSPDGRRRARPDRPSGFVWLMAVVMIVVGLIASIGPARRSLKIHPLKHFGLNS
jgi:putative ABC transport system permease protein